MTVNRRQMLMHAACAAALGASGPRALAEPGVPPASRELRVPVKGGNLYVRVNGDLQGGKPPLLLVHGGPGGALWQFFPALPLASERAIVLYDQLDSGRSDAPGEPANWTVDRFVSEIDSIRAALGLERLHLLGHSWGGIVANRYASRQPQGLCSLILQGTPLSAARFETSIQSLYSKLPDGAGDVIRQHERAGATSDAAYANAVRAFRRRHLARTSVKDIAMPYMAPTPEDRGDALAQAMTGGRLGDFGGMLAGFNDEPLLARVAVPTLLLAGEFDIVTPQANRALLPLLKRGRYAEIADAGHMAQFDQPQAWRASVQGFLAAHDA